MKFYILENGEPVEVSMLEWAEFFEKESACRQIGLTMIGANDSIFVSTVFVGFNMGLSEESPLLFETIIYVLPEAKSGNPVAFRGRCSTMQAAVDMHEKAVKEVYSSGKYDKYLTTEP